MRIKQVKLKNFRGYKDEQTLDIEDGLTAIVGKNDSGKSSILEALEIYFENNVPDIDDLNVYCGKDRNISITCVFDDLPKKITVDATADTTLQREYMVNKDGNLEVVKTFRCTSKTVDKEPQVNIRCIHPTEESYEDLLTLKIEDLRKRATKLGVESGDDRVSNEIRGAIWNKVGDLKLKEVMLSYNDLSEKFQSVYKNLEKQFPDFFVFKVDRQTKDSDDEAKDPIGVAVKEAKKQYDADIKNLEQKIVDSVKDVTERALEKLREMDATLAEKLTPEFKKRPSWQFDFKIHDQRGVPLNKRGSGTRRLVLLNFFRAEAERKSGASERNIIYAIEEPETSQHPNNQSMIISSLLELANDSKRQVLVTTHSSELIEGVSRDSVRFINYVEEDPIVVNGEQGLILASDSLGRISAQKFGSARKIVLVEGTGDCTFLDQTSTKLKAAGKISKDFKDEHILALPLGGVPGVKKWIENNKAEDLGLKYFILLDSDRKSSSSEMTENEIYVEQLQRDGFKAHVTRKREIENYIDTGITNCSYNNFDDAKTLIAQTNSIGKSEVMETYWPLMSAEQIEAVSTYKDDSGNEVNELLELIKEIIRL